MRATVSLDDELLRTAEEYSGLTERAALIREALKSLIAREAGRPAPGVGRKGAFHRGCAPAAVSTSCDPGGHLSLDRHVSQRHS